MFMMAVGQSVYILPILFHTIISDWVELPKLTSTKVNESYSFSAHKLPLSTPISTLFTDSNITITSKLPSTVPSFPVGTTSSQSEMIKDSEATANESIPEKLRIPSKEYNSGRVDSLHESVEVINESNSESRIIEEAFEDAKNNYMNQPTTSVVEKLKHLHRLQDKLFIHIRRLSQGIWTDRQARGKKLMGFASMEGALMTIAFLTFAVFLIKIVHQFIRGLQDPDLTMLLTMPTTPAPARLSRHSRSDNQLAAAQLLQYMDQFSIKHRLHCDSP